MQEFIQLYNENQDDIKRFLIQTIRNNGELLENDITTVRQFFSVFASLELVYIADSQQIQVSDNVFKHRLRREARGRDRGYLTKGSKVIDSEEAESVIRITDPYVSVASGESCVTVIVVKGEHFFFFDFNLSRLLARFGLVERHPAFNFITKAFYFGIGVSMMFFSVMSIGYAFYEYFLQFVSDVEYTLESVFKPIISITLGLAIFDLAKTLLEREVIYKAYADKKDEDRLLSKFLIAIIIALSIEALMVVFKTALHDPSQMLFALYLIIGVAFIIISLAIYNWVSMKKRHH